LLNLLPCHGAVANNDALAPEYGTVFRADWLSATNRKIGCRYGTYAERKAGIGFVAAKQPAKISRPRTVFGTKNWCKFLAE
jgi:hypothetical protein